MSLLGLVFIDAKVCDSNDDQLRKIDVIKKELEEMMKGEVRKMQKPVCFH